MMKINYVDHLEIVIEQKKKTYVEEVVVKKPPKDRPDKEPVETLERRYTYDLCDIFEGFDSLCRASKIIEDTAKFSKSDKLGFLTSLPRDLGFFELSV
jgi:hypothetical protein